MHSLLESWSDYGIPSCELTIIESKIERESEVSDSDPTDSTINVQDHSFMQFDRKGDFRSCTIITKYAL